jgi:hypothetical protein
MVSGDSHMMSADDYSLRLRLSALQSQAALEDYLDPETCLVKIVYPPLACRAEIAQVE